MRLLAEFIMRGRAQAAAVAILGGALFLPILSQTSLSLVTLRKGFAEGALITLYALIPSLIFIFSGVDARAGKYFIELLLLTFAAALVLRNSVSLPLTSVAIVVLSAVASLLLVAMDPAIADELGQALAVILQNIQQEQAQLPAEFEAVFSNYTALKSAGLIAFLSTWAVLIGLVAGRWLQAVLYNPGGFQAEFHHFRINLPVLLASLAAAIFFEFKGFEFMHWVNLCLMPVVVTGLSLVHFLAKKLKIGYAGLSIFYVSVVLFPPLMMLVTLFLGVTDPWVNYRERFQFKQ